MYYRDLLNKKYSIKLFLVIMIFILIILSIYIAKQKIMDVYKTEGYVLNSQIIINIPIEYSDTLNNLEYIKVNNYKYYLNELNISEILFDEKNLIYYQQITIESKDTLNDNMLISVVFYGNEETVLQKIKKLLF